ncbi:hypothetical protein [Halostreptopolyspora alba]|uniref:Uncharacterized protein n=1 Tax=Halostreptopolyspora alba TaxID=2487137 RepID=A0A3N0EHP5_9ACTN|nr:hypothetical protein EFW17_00855 [Nocardiopsaceae bacterium YIM 96095]
MSAAAPTSGEEPGRGPVQPSEDDSVAKLIEIAHRPTVAERLVSWASRPPGRLYVPACVVAALILLHEDSMPGGHLPSWAIGVGGGTALAAMGALRLGIALTVARSMIRHYWLRWIAAPAIALVTLVLAVTDVPLQARVEASSGALLEVGETANRSTTIPLNGSWSGLYPLKAVGLNGDVTHYTVQGAGLLNESGLAHSAEPLPTEVFVGGPGNTVVYEHITGDWYSWSAY